MIRRLHTPLLPENELRRITQKVVDSTKRKAYKECLVAGECEGPIVGGHLIPRAWLRKICDHNEEVMVFEKLPLRPFTGNKGPVLDHINNATVGSFTCRRHEEMFGPIDDPDPDLTNQNNLNLMLYKAIIATLWLQKLLLKMWQDELALVPQDESFEFGVNLQEQRILGLNYYKQKVEDCLSPQTCLNCKDGKCGVIGHRVFNIPGEPALAVSDFSDGIRTRTNPRFNPPTEYIMNWGMTVLPLSTGHKVILHHFIEEEGIIEPLGQVLSRFHGKKLQGQISYWVLKSFENLAINPGRWEQFGKRRNAMLDVFRNEMPDIGFGSMEQIRKWEEDRLNPDSLAFNYNQLNLFNPEKR